MERCAKIVATIGPASQDVQVLRELIRAGMNVARLNFSHGTHEDHAAVIARLRSLSAELDIPVTILQDLQGPKIRAGNLAAGQVELKSGNELILTTESVPGDQHEVPVDFPELPQSVHAGGRILLDDGKMELSVTGVSDHTVDTRVVQGGILKSHKGINLPGAHIPVPSLTEKDEVDLAFGLEQGVDAVALSFVRTAKDVEHLREAIQRLAPGRSHPLVIAKLEKPEAIDNLENIMEITDGVMVARGDLGVEMSPEAVPIAQKQIIECANRHDKIVITATQMLESMMQNPRPTRAEASDVANAIFDGTDAVMLSGETAAGQFPIESVKMMDSIVREAEAHMDEWGHWQGCSPCETLMDDTFYMTQAAAELAHNRNVSAIAVFTQTGRTALLMSKTRPRVIILGFTPDPKIYYQLPMFWGVHPYLVPHANTIKTMLLDVEKAIRKDSPVAPGQQVVLICGFPVDRVGPTNLALLHTIGARLD
jgi:pyruvate kinase